MSITMSISFAPRAGSLKRLRFGFHCAERESDDAAGRNVRPRERGGNLCDMHAVHAYACKMIRLRFRTERLDVRAGRIGLQVRVVDIPVEFHFVCFALLVSFIQL